MGDATSVPKTGLHLLDDVDLFNMLCIPPYNDENFTADVVYTNAVRLCEDRRAMLIVDSPEKWTDKNKAKDGIDAGGFERHKNAALYFPRIKSPDPLDENRLKTFVPCGAVAGVIARTDSERGVWKAPAGIEAALIGVSDLTVQLN